FDAGIVLVAAGLVDGALAAPLGLQRLHRHAVRFHPAVAAAFAHQLVDDDPLVGIGELAALAPAALLGGAGLVVDQHGAAGERRQLALHRHQVVAVVNGEPRGPVLAAGILPRLVGDHDDLLGALGGDLAGDLRHGQPAVIGLAAGHGDGVVEQDLVGDVDAR